MNILIVDDNKNNRMIISLLLEEYIDEKGLTGVQVDEAEDGLIALEKVKQTKYNLIFMDIMMPNMDGITATKEIRKNDSKVMIIAVSAVDDDERKKVILTNGAEDYLSKPVNADVFSVRLQSYLQLINSRQNNNDLEYKPYNLFSKTIYNRYMRFYGRSEDNLAEMWEYYLLSDTQYDDLSDLIRFVYAACLELHGKGEKLNVIEEQNEDTLYLTIVAQSDISTQWATAVAQKNSYVHEYKIKKNRLSTALSKTITAQEVEVVAVPKEVVVPNIVEDVEVVAVPEIPQEKKKHVSVENEVFDILDNYDKIDIEEYINQLNSILLVMGSSELEMDEVRELISVLQQIAGTLSSYTEFFAVSQSMSRLASIIDENVTVFLEKSMDMAPLTKAFGRDITTWKESLFVTGAPSVNFMDDSIISNVNMIESYIYSDDEEESAEELDDIFDF